MDKCLNELKEGRKNILIEAQGNKHKEQLNEIWRAIQDMKI